MRTINTKPADTTMSVTQPARGDLEWSITLLDGKAVNYDDAEKAVAELGEGWRLPTIEELFSLIDHRRDEPAIDTDAFPDTRSAQYWTSTPCAWRPDAGRWVVDFRGGLVHVFHRYYEACVRPVRAGRCVPASSF